LISRKAFAWLLPLSKGPYYIKLSIVMISAYKNRSMDKTVADWPEGDP